MPTQEQYYDVITRASMVNADAVKDAVDCERSGCDANWSEDVCWWRKINSAQFCYSIGDYSSDQSVSLYNQLMGYSGLKYISGLSPDPNAQPIDGNVLIIPPSVPTTYTYTEANLLDAGGGNWYLPFLLPDQSQFHTGTVPIFMSINGVQTSAINIDETVSPARIYGFGGNYSQIIVLTVIQGVSAPN